MFERIEPVVGIFIKASTAGEDNKSNFSITENRQFISLLEQAVATFAEGNLAIGGVLDPLDLYFPSSTFLLRTPF